MGSRWNANDLAEDELFTHTAGLWRKRFGQLLRDHDYTQTQFRDRLNESLAKSGSARLPHYTQSDISEWLSLGTHKPGDRERIRRTLFPRVEVLLHIAQILNVDVGYLIGETSERDQDCASVARYLGISEEAVRALQSFGPQDSKSERDEANSKEAELLSRLFRIDAFWRCMAILECLRKETPLSRATPEKTDLTTSAKPTAWERKSELHLLFESIIDELIDA